MKKQVLFIAFIFTAAIVYPAPIPDIVYLSKGANVQIGVIKGLDADRHLILFRHSDFNPAFGTKMTVHPETGNFAVFLTGAPLGQPTLAKSMYCSWGNLETGLAGYVEIRSGAGDFYSKPFFSPGGETIYYSGLSKFESVINSIDPVSKKQTKVFYNKWPSKYKPGKVQFGNTVFSLDQTGAAFTVGSASESAIYTWAFADKTPKKVLTVKNLLDQGLSWFGDYVFYCDYTFQKNNYKKVYLNILDVRTMKSQRVFEYTEGSGTHGEFPPETMVFDAEGNMVFFMDTHDDAFMTVADIYIMSMDTFVSEKIIENAYGLYAVSPDGNLLLYSEHKTPVDITDPANCYPTQKNPICIAVYDIRKGKSKKLAIPGLADFEYINFVY